MAASARQWLILGASLLAFGGCSPQPPAAQPSAATAEQEPAQAEQSPPEIVEPIEQPVVVRSPMSKDQATTTIRESLEMLQRVDRQIQTAPEGDRSWMESLAAANEDLNVASASLVIYESDQFVDNWQKLLQKASETDQRAIACLLNLKQLNDVVFVAHACEFSPIYEGNAVALTYPSVVRDVKGRKVARIRVDSEAKLPDFEAEHANASLFKIGKPIESLFYKDIPIVIGVEKESPSRPAKTFMPITWQLRKALKEMQRPRVCFVSARLGMETERLIKFFEKPQIPGDDELFDRSKIVFVDEGRYP